MNLKFHHLGIACSDISESIALYLKMGYTIEGSIFTDEQIGICGQFMTQPNAPRIELVQNLDGSSILDYWLINGSPMYHLAFTSDVPFESFKRDQGELLVFGPTPATAFQNKNVWFTMKQNRQMVEYIDASSK
jgi:methylmalonyl-CoA/ethylmalonyl-CoA epimerase